MWITLSGLYNCINSLLNTKHPLPILYELVLDIFFSSFISAPLSNLVTSSRRGLAQYPLGLIYPFSSSCYLLCFQTTISATFFLNFLNILDICKALHPLPEFFCWKAFRTNPGLKWKLTLWLYDLIQFLSICFCGSCCSTSESVA